jgi:type III secretory pathway component EscR
VKITTSNGYVTFLGYIAVERIISVILMDCNVFYFSCTEDLSIPIEVSIQDARVAKVYFACCLFSA